MPRQLSFVAAALVGSAAAAFAQGTLTSADRDYLQKDAKGAAYELALARLATDRASRDDVKAYARKLVADHDAYNAALQALGKSKGVQLPADMDASDTLKLTAIKALSGSLFDKAFLEEEARINADDVADADKEKATTGDSEVRDFVARFAAMDNDHQMLAKSLGAAK